MDDAPGRRWFRFSLRGLLIGVLVAAVPLGFLARSMQLAARQRRAVDALKESGFGCNYDYGTDESGNDRYESHLPPWLLARFGEDFFYSVKSVFSFEDKPAEGLSHLRDFRDLERVDVVDRPIGDAVARQLSGLQQLKSLELSNSALTDEGLKYIRGLTGLESLYLHDNPISGAGLIYIGDSRHLTTLMLESTRFDNRGMRFLKPLTELRQLGIGTSPAPRIPSLLIRMRSSRERMFFNAANPWSVIPVSMIESSFIEAIGARNLIPSSVRLGELS